MKEKLFSLLRKYGAEAGDPQPGLRDLLTDLRHLADEYGLDFRFAVEGSREVYLEEREEVASKFVATVTVTDPDTGLPAEVEIRKLEGGPMVGFDGSFLSQLGDGEQPNSPYDADVKIIIPDNE